MMHIVSPMGHLFPANLAYLSPYSLREFFSVPSFHFIMFSCVGVRDNTRAWPKLLLGLWDFINSWMPTLLNIFFILCLPSALFVVFDPCCSHAQVLEQHWCMSSTFFVVILSAAYFLFSLWKRWKMRERNCIIRFNPTYYNRRRSLGRVHCHSITHLLTKSRYVQKCIV